MSAPETDPLKALREVAIQSLSEAMRDKGGEDIGDLMRVLNEATDQLRKAAAVGEYPGVMGMSEPSLKLIGRVVVDRMKAEIVESSAQDQLDGMLLLAWMTSFLAGQLFERARMDAVRDLTKIERVDQ